MLLQPVIDQSMFEVCIYNKDVRALVKENQSHIFYGDHWADTQVHDIIAHDEDEARALIERRFPPEDGFVIEKLSICHY